MKNDTVTITDILRLAVAVLIVKVTIGVVSNYADYLPPDFESDFLVARRSYFFGPYSVAFYAPIVAGPLSLFGALVLLSQRFRNRFPNWHRRLGRVQVVVVLLVSASGLLMSRQAATGAVAAIGFASLAIATGVFVVLGLRSAIRKRFGQHQRWMWRCFLCLCSAVILRLTAGLSLVTSVGGGWVYPLSAWSSWLVPLGIFEAVRLWQSGWRLTVRAPQSE